MGSARSFHILLTGGSWVALVTGEENVEGTAPLSMVTVWAGTRLDNTNTLEKASTTAQRFALFWFALVTSPNGDKITLSFSSTLTIFLPLPQQCRPDTLISGMFPPH